MPRMTQNLQKTPAFANTTEKPDHKVVHAMVLGARNEAGSTPRKGSTPLQDHLLPFRFILFNLVAFALAGAAYMQGWVNLVVAADTTGLSVAIFAVFLGGLVVCARRIWQINKELNCVDSFDPCQRSLATTYLAEVAGRGSGSRAITGSALRVRLSDRIAIVRHVANSLVLLGLIGTVTGFIIALSGIDPATAGNVSAIGPMVANLIRGMSVALYTTLLGSVFSLWLTVNYRVLVSGTIKLAIDLVALGEANAQPGPA